MKEGKIIVEEGFKISRLPRKFSFFRVIRLIEKLYSSFLQALPQSEDRILTLFTPLQKLFSFSERAEMKRLESISKKV